MKEIISKELLSEVLGEKVSNIYGFTNSINDLEYKLLSTVDGNSINIYELEHRCKGWLFYKNIKFSYQTLEKRIESDLNHFVEVDGKYGFHDKSEHEAIFKACQWVYDNKDRK